MPPKKGDANITSRGMKMKEVAAILLSPPSLPLSVPPVRYCPLHLQPLSPFYSNGSCRLDLNTSNQHHHPNPPLASLNASSPFKSFTSLSTGDQDSLPPSLKEQNAQIDQIIKSQGENLKCMLADMQRRLYNVLVNEAEEKESKRVKEREWELNQLARKIAGYQHRENLLEKENEILQNKVNHLEDTATSLRAALQEATVSGGREERGGCSDDPLDDVESAHVDPHRVEPIMLVCRACGKRVATVMMWPCRHVCTCMPCDEITKTCPVCSSTKASSIEVCFP